MNWMETNRVPFSLLTDAEQSEMKAHGGPYEYYNFEYKIWFRADVIYSLNFTYRIISKDLTKAYIDWSQVSCDFNFLWSTNDGLWLLSKRQPIISKLCGLWSNSVLKANVFSSFKPGTCNWQHSVVERPT